MVHYNAPRGFGEGDIGRILQKPAAVLTNLKISVVRLWEEAVVKVMLDQQEDCLKGKCTRKIIISKGTLPVLELQNMTVFFQQHGRALPVFYSGMYIYGTEEELFIKINKQLTVLWNGKGTVTVSMKMQINVTGLCSHSSDVVGHTFAATWELEKIGMSCSTKPAEDHQICQLADNCLNKGRNLSCSLKTLSILQQACRNDVCWGNDICPARLTLMRLCESDETDGHLTPVARSCIPECRATYYFSVVASLCPTTCQNYRNKVQCKGPGLLGCVCPDDLVSYNGTCVRPQDCPCSYNGEVFKSGQNIQLFCLKCKCQGGQMDCSDLDCPAVCSVSGRQYIATFDGTRYYFSGGCKHVLVTTDKFTVYLGTNTCQEADSDNCIEYVILTIKAVGISIKLTKAGRVFLGKKVIELPYVYRSAPTLSIRLASSMFLEIVSLTGVHIQYDFKGGRLYVILQPHMMGETLGLCGTYNRNRLDDFMSSSKLIDSTPMAFVNSWRASSQCTDSPLLPVHEPCKINYQKESYAKEKCSIIKSDIFKSCHFISPEQFYDQCRHDVCSCSDSETCLCTAIANYAHVCLLYGVLIDFRATVRECGEYLL
ncbi:otogelin-like protein [Heptranchias perlo]|uniref:otogelin-like protein n=1 Tax=Heptranchias perlo TaxID=212740 RepID=UPI0035595F61